MHRRVEWEVLEAEVGGILFMWNSSLCVVTEVIRGRHSILVAFLDSESEEFWVTGVHCPLSIRGRGCFGRS